MVHGQTALVIGDTSGIGLVLLTSPWGTGTTLLEDGANVLA